MDNFFRNSNLCSNIEDIRNLANARKIPDSDSKRGLIMAEYAIKITKRALRLAKMISVIRNMRTTFFSVRLFVLRLLVRRAINRLTEQLTD